MNPTNLAVKNRYMLGVFFVVAFALQPLYLFPSGLPQPTDVLLLLWASILMILTARSFSLGKMPGFSSFLKPWTLLVIYIGLVNAIWSVILKDYRTSYSSLFYLYNWIVGVSVAHFISLNPVAHRRYIRWGLYSAVIMAWILLVSGFDELVARQTGGFNNPNQLGYFSLLMLCSISLITPRGERLRWPFWASTIGSIALSVFSFSLATLSSMSLAVFGLLIYHRIALRIGRLLIGAFTVVCVIILIHSIEAHVYVQDGLEARMRRAEQKIEDLSAGGRGYQRIYDYRQYTALGAGEGVHERFSGNFGGEIHSVPGTILFSYGIPGLMLSGYMLWLVARRQHLAVLLILSAPLLYSFTHQGMRSTAFWLFFLIGMRFPVRHEPNNA